MKTEAKTTVWAIAVIGIALTISFFLTRKRNLPMELATAGRRYDYNTKKNAGLA